MKTLFTKLFIFASFASAVIFFILEYSGIFSLDGQPFIIRFIVITGVSICITYLFKYVDGPFKSIIIRKLKPVKKGLMYFIKDIPVFLHEVYVRLKLKTPFFFKKLQILCGAAGITSIYMVKNGIDFQLYGISVVTLLGGGGAAGVFISKMIVKEYADLEKELKKETNQETEQAPSGPQAVDHSTTGAGSTNSLDPQVVESESHIS